MEACRLSWVEVRGVRVVGCPTSLILLSSWMCSAAMSLLLLGADMVDSAGRLRQRLRRWSQRRKAFWKAMARPSLSAVEEVGLTDCSAGRPRQRFLRVSRRWKSWRSDATPRVFSAEGAVYCSCGDVLGGETVSTPVNWPS